MSVIAVLSIFMTLEPAKSEVKNRSYSINSIIKGLSSKKITCQKREASWTKPFESQYTSLIKDSLAYTAQTKVDVWTTWKNKALKR